jgi:CHASE3 domain sensor protein
MRRKWWQVLTPLNIISTLPLLFAMLCGGYLSYRYNILLRENRDLVVHTYQVINAIDGLLLRLEDAETGQRGYLITGDESYLAPYERTSVDLSNALAALDRLVSDSQPQLSRILPLRTAVTAKLDELGMTIALRQNKDFEAARSAVITNDGKRTMDEIRAIVGDMIAWRHSFAGRPSRCCSYCVQLSTTS